MRDRVKKIFLQGLMVALVASIAIMAFHPDTLEAFNQRTSWVRKWLSVGYRPTSTKIPDALVYVQNGVHPEAAVTDDLVYLKAMASQSGDFLECVSSADATLFKIASDGDITLGGTAASEHIANGRLATTYYQTVTGAQVDGWNRNHVGGFSAKIAEAGVVTKASINNIAGGFIAAQLGEDAGGITDFDVIGLEAKSTVDRDAGGTSVAKALYAKMIARKTGTTLAAGYPVYSLIEINNSAIITTTANYHAALTNEGTLGTVSVLSVAADTWDVGINLNGATITSDIVLQNGGVIEESTNGVVVMSSLNGLQIPVITSASPTEPVACGATTVGTMSYVNDSDDGAAAQVCICAGITNDATYDWVQMKDMTTACSMF
ncbi:MAG: hypothetical protein GY923_15460 [Aestuariibacter sp.]|nr:hypothetical protein [Aestuariibacter sp.]